MYIDNIKGQAKDNNELYRYYRNSLDLIRDLKIAGIDLNKHLTPDCFIDLLEIIQYAHRDTKNKSEFDYRLNKLLEMEEFKAEYTTD